MKHLIIIVLSIIMSMNTMTGQSLKWEGRSVDFNHGRLKVSENKRYLVFDDGTPFFYLGDTGWELFHRLTKEETGKYLENRRSKGFTVIQAVVLAELDGLQVPNAEGHLPFIDMDPLKPEEAYFAHVDWVIKNAEEKGIFIGLLPTWGDKVDKKWGVGPVVFDKDNAYKYGRWIGNRYKDSKNIIWILGGDRDGDGNNKPVWDAMANGIKSVDKNHLMTYHPSGERSSSEWFQNSDWLDFNMCQTGHGQRSYAIYKRMIVRDYNQKPVKPCMDGEPRYEDHPVGWNPDVLGWFNDADVRQALYWNLFSGSFGHTYGCHAIWQMLAPGREPVGLARHFWYEDIDLPGASELIYARKLIESRPFLSRQPDQSLIAGGYYPETDYIVATRGDRYAFVYFPTGWQADIDMTKLGATELKAYWYNPRNGESVFIGKFEAKGLHKFTPPSSGRGNDWILVIDDAAAGFGTPGKKI